MMMTRLISALDGVGITVDVAVGKGVLVKVIVGFIVGAAVAVDEIKVCVAVSLGGIKVIFGLTVGVIATPHIFGAGLQATSIKIKDKTKKRFRIISPNLLKIVTTKETKSH
jgi:hypothetical protein